MRNLKRLSWRELRADLSGGLAGALVSIPQSMGMGVVAFAPLGAGYATLGLVAGLLGAAITTACSALFGGTPGLISGPRGSVSLVFAAIIAALLEFDDLFVPGVDKAPIVLSLAMIALIGAGAMEAAFGLCRVGNAIKFVPYPVISGFLNAAAILIILGQLRILFELPPDAATVDLWRFVDADALARCGLVIVTMVAIMAMPKLLPRVPGLLSGAAVGAVAYYAVLATGTSLDLGATMPGIQGIPVDPGPLRDLFGLIAAGWTAATNGSGVATFGGLVLGPDTVPVLLAILVPGAISIALLESFDSLFSSVALDDMSLNRSDGKRELVAQGAGTMLGAAFGFLGGSGSLVRTIPCFRAGGRTAWSALTSAIFVLAATLLLATFVKGIPMILVTSVLIVISLGLFDKWTLDLLANVRSNGLATQRAVLVDIAIICLVVGASLVFDLIVAVGVGMAVAIAAFVFSVGRSPIRRSYRGDAVSSFLQRGEFSAALLRDHGGLIAILELEGPLFFGSAGKVEQEVARLADAGVCHVILDLKRVGSIDSTASRTISRISRRLDKEGKTLSISYLMPELRLPHTSGSVGEIRRHPSNFHEHWQNLRQFGALEAIGRHRCFSDTDTAIRQCEMLLIEAISGNGGPGVSAWPSMTGLLDALSGAELEIVRSFCEECRFDAGTTIFRQGDPGDVLYILLDGTVDAVIHHETTGRSVRVNTMTKGAVFGEMAILDPKPRSATIVSMEDTTCYRMSAQQLERLNAENPSLGLRLMKYMCLLFTTRLRMANLAIIELES